MAGLSSLGEAARARLGPSERADWAIQGKRRVDGGRGLPDAGEDLAREGAGGRERRVEAPSARSASASVGPSSLIGGAQVPLLGGQGRRRGVEVGDQVLELHLVAVQGARDLAEEATSRLRSSRWEPRSPR